MSELNGFFSLRTTQDLVAKLAFDFQRLAATEPTDRLAHYAAYDFFVCALHLADWASAATGRTLASLRSYPDGALVSHIANGAKHFHVDVKRHTKARDTRTQRSGFQAGAFQLSAFQSAQLVVDLEDGSAVSVLDLAARVLRHWQDAVADESSNDA